MSKQFTVKAHKNHVDHRTALLRFYRKQRGQRKTRKGYWVPRTLYRDIEQLLKWWDAEYRRARKRKPWHTDADQKLWELARQKLLRDLEGADLDAVYPDNAWFWNHALLKLAIYLEVLKTSPSPTQLLIDSVKETITERVQDAQNFIDNAGDAVENIADAAAKAADAVVDAGERAWSGIKIAAVVGGCAIGAAIVVPPVVRAFRKKPENQP